jgi:ribosome assembly protein YihI (activator of Der GTPase)
MKDEEQNEVYDEHRYYKWVDSYLSGEIDKAVLFSLLTLEKIFRSLPDDEHQWLHVKATINIVIACLVAKKRLSPKEEQEIDKVLDKASGVLTNGGLSEADAAEIEKVLEEIPEIVVRQ